MEISATDIPEVVVIEPRQIADHRGVFFEAFRESWFDAIVGRSVRFVQDNQSRSNQHVIRGLHYQQSPRAQGKLIRVLQGEIFDVAVDLRRQSATFGHWTSAILSADNNRQLWIPEGFAHGFQVLSDSADVFYKVTDYFSPEHERAINWRDTDIGILWPRKDAAILSDKDAQAPPFAEAVYVNSSDG